MTFRRALIAATLFLAASYMELYLPPFTEQVLPVLREQIDRQSVALPLPEAALAWLDTF